MAKSTGNIARVGELLVPASRRGRCGYALISVHYRAALNHSEESLAAAAAAVERLDAASPRSGRTGRSGRRPDAARRSTPLARRSGRRSMTT